VPFVSSNLTRRIKTVRLRSAEGVMREILEMSHRMQDARSHRDAQEARLCEAALEDLWDERRMILAKSENLSDFE